MDEGTTVTGPTPHSLYLAVDPEHKLAAPHCAPGV